MYSRRDFGKAGMAGFAASALAGSLGGVAFAQSRPRIDSTVNGVRIGMGTGSLNPLPQGVDPIDAIIKGFTEAGVGYVEIVNSGVVEPSLPGTNRGGRIPDPLTPEWNENRPKLREWRLNTPVSHYQAIRKRFDDAGLKLISYVMTFTSDFTPEEFDAVFRGADALGVEVITTNQTQTFLAKRLAPYAAKYKAKPSWHNHARTNDANEIASLTSFEEALSYSPNFKVNLDIGHFTAGNQDAIAFLQKNHARISHIHVKDRKRDNGPNVAWGTGDTPIVQALRMIRDNKWPIYVVQEREFQPPAPFDPIAEVKKNLAFMKQALA